MARSARRASGLLRLLCRLRYRLSYCHAFFGSEQRDQDIAFHARHRLDLPVFADFPEQARHFGAPYLLVRHFAPAMENHRANFVALPQEPDDLILANLIIVLRGGRTKFYFFQLRAATALALLVGLFILLVKKFAVIGDFANRRIGRRRNFHQIQSAFARHFNGFERLHDAKLTAFFIDDPDFTRPDTLVHASAIGLPEVTFCDNSP
jgi:hypothetical protein